MTDKGFGTDLNSSFQICLKKTKNFNKARAARREAGCNDTVLK